MSSELLIQSNNLISTGLNNAHDLYERVKNGLRYFEITEDLNQYPSTLIDVGPICNNETTSFSFDTTQYWDKDVMYANVRNSQKVSNDLEWNENSNFNNGKLQQKPGMLVNTTSATGYNQDDVTFFNNIKDNNINNVVTSIDTISNINGEGFATDIFGYFHPDYSGEWKFTFTKQNQDDSIYFWISKDRALYDYTSDNADICKNSVSIGNNNYQAAVNLTNGDYVPFRIQIISNNTKTYSYFFNVTPPPSPAQSDASVGSQFFNPNTKWNYFVTFYQADNTVYYKQLNYFGLVQDTKEGTKFNCFFVQTTPQNIQKLLTYKKTPNNPPLQYIKVPIPTPVTFSGGGTAEIQDGNPLNIDLPPGVPLNIDGATYGLSDDWNYNKYINVPYQDTKYIKEATTTTQLSVTDPNLPSKQYTAYEPAYTIPVTRYKQEAIPVTETQHADVKSQVQSMVSANNGNALQLDDPQNVLANPINNPKNPNINVPKNLTVQYSYSQQETKNVQNKTLYLDPSNANITIGFSYYNQAGTSPLTMDKTPTCTGDCSNYQMVLTNDAKLAVNDAGGNMVGYIDLSNSIITVDPNFSLNSCQVNTAWKRDPQAVKSLKANVPLMGGKKLISPDSRFKLSFSNGNLVLSYCYIPYRTADNGVKYTTQVNVGGSTPTQILYLYRIPTRGIIGKKFLNVFDTATGVRKLHYLPNNYNNILNMTTYTNPYGTQNVYPVFSNGALVNSSNYTNVDGSSQQDCSDKCSDTKNNCDHFFLVNNSTCYFNTNLDSNPLYTTTNNNPSINSSNLYKKNYNIKSDTKNIQSGLSLLTAPSSNIAINSAYINYTPGKNAPNLAYYSGLDEYIQADAVVKNAYQNVLGKEGFDQQTTTILQKVSNLKDMSNQFSQTQDQINEKYNQTITNLADYKDKYDKASTPTYKYSGTDSIIPDKYKNDDNLVPAVTIQDGQERDVNIMLLHQNTMNTLACITAATFLIIAIVIGRE